ncbi:TetR/AcrR family transcriptional regulator [Candidatus Mycolicibacterium alkanivorans]|uniref:TetR/AcrR family transcriptional regulator C-terminal ligand-binding domain-containing protein n=1 Tax=Candidatus Mycolicibacterium alkanivorans TaxID=2954114 RepID=A0ABS9YUS2_9MYCO|nr:TetR/AcrR family transcriptional regulator C-terminal ligand-binding domain-containing protein [Candidatus Mycolicibacterium alkanivorans]MCI4674109.1 TetR/AcrR family transcriptional regulator C-terminal ligand-binding domain-containing protein [Candidatus Mycolicibacterium alkanivorans]
MAAAQTSGLAAALREGLESGDPCALSVDRISQQSGVHKTTIYRRWMSSEGALADLLSEITAAGTPLPDSGDLEKDLRTVAQRLPSPTRRPRRSSAKSPQAPNPVLKDAAGRFWSSLVHHTAENVRRAQQRGTVDPTVTADSVVETLTGPL